MHWIASYLCYVGKMAVPQIQMPRISGNGLVEGLIPVTRDDVILLLAYHHLRAARDRGSGICPFAWRQVDLSDRKVFEGKNGFLSLFNDDQHSTEPGLQLGDKWRLTDPGILF